MTTSTRLLLTSPSPQIIAELARRQPDWQVLPLGDQDQDYDLPPGGPIWGFIDWLCPSMSGLELCRRLREAEAMRGAHLTMVLDNGDNDARRRALQAGADDYIIGPLDAGRLIERIARTITPSNPARQRFTNGPISIDIQAHQVRVNGTLVMLRPNEFQLLAHFMEHPDQVFSRTALIDRLGKDGGDIDERTVDVWVGRLRRALQAHDAPDPLRTVRSLGYVMDSI
ncbi:MAG: hypothetical protein RLZZ427_1091 [Pseudomonadota bacterium]|jgi:two-component system phosphate regulon response regulator PhoB